MQTGIILATKNALIPDLNTKTEKTAARLTNFQESLLKPIHPLSSKSIDQKVLLDLGGDMSTYT